MVSVDTAEQRYMIICTSKGAKFLFGNKPSQSHVAERKLRRFAIINERKYFSPVSDGGGPDDAGKCKNAAINIPTSWPL